MRQIQLMGLTVFYFLFNSEVLDLDNNKTYKPQGHLQVTSNWHSFFFSVVFLFVFFNFCVESIFEHLQTTPKHSVSFFFVILEFSQAFFTAKINAITNLMCIIA